MSLHLSLMRDSLLCMVNEAGTVGGYIKNPAHFKVARSVERLIRYRVEGRGLAGSGGSFARASGVIEGKKEEEG